MTIDILNSKTIDINVIPTEAHLGMLKKSLILPVRVQSAIAIIIDAKNNISISFKLHKINMATIKPVIDNKVVSSKFIFNV